MKRILAFILIIATLLTLTACGEEEREDISVDKQKEMAPDFTAYTEDGTAVKLSDYFGKPMVLNFWASWCGPCRSEMGEFDEKYKAYGGDVQFLMVNLTVGSETVEAAKGFVEEQGYSFPVLYDKDSQGANTYGIQSIPTTFFISKEGHLIAQANGAIDGETLQKGIDMAIKG